MKQILVTGGCGFVGRHLVNFLLKENPLNRIWIIDDLSTGQPIGTWIDREDRGRVFRYYRDLRAFLNIDGRDYLDLPHFEEVYHLASIVGGRTKIENDPLAVGIDLAIDSTFWLWVAKKGKPDRILYASSSAAYPIVLQEDNKYNATFALREDEINLKQCIWVGKPDLTYGWSKLTGEYLGLLAHQKYGLNVAIVRPFSGYGEDQDLTYPFPSIIKRVQAHENPVIVWGSGLQGRDFIHISDAVEGMVLACRKISDASAVNLGTGLLTNFRQLASRMIEIEGYDASVGSLEEAPTGVFSRYADITLMKKVLGWEPKITLGEGIRRALNK